MSAACRSARADLFARKPRPSSQPAFRSLLLAALLFILPGVTARAQQTTDTAAITSRPAANRTYFGQDIYVAAGQRVGNATCFFCSVQVEGDVSGRVLVIFGNLTVVGRVEHDAVVIRGNAIIDAEARVVGTTAVVGGNAVYESDESLSGDAWVLGGHMSNFAGGHTSERRHLSLSPLAASLIVLAALLLLSPLFLRRQRAMARAE